VVEVGRLKWRGQIFRMQEQNPCRKLTVYEPDVTRRVGRRAVRWLESAEDLKTRGGRSWRRKSQDRGKWRSIVEEAKVHLGL
jgi:hypothetical protein